MLSENQFWTLGTDAVREREKGDSVRKEREREKVLLSAASAREPHTRMIYARRAVIFGSDAKTHN